jgi:hypothetical protein
MKIQVPLVVRAEDGRAAQVQGLGQPVEPDQVGQTRRMHTPAINRCKNHRFPGGISSHSVWFSCRCCLLCMWQGRSDAPSISGSRAQPPGRPVPAVVRGVTAASQDRHQGDHAPWTRCNGNDTP